MQDHEIFGVKPPVTGNLYGAPSGPPSDGMPRPGDPDARYNINAYYNSDRHHDSSCPVELSQEQPPAYVPYDDFLRVFRDLTLGVPSANKAPKYLVNRSGRNDQIAFTAAPLTPEIILGHHVKVENRVLTALCARPSEATVEAAAKYAVEVMMTLLNNKDIRTAYENAARDSGLGLSADQNIGDDIPVFDAPRLIVSFHPTSPRDILVVRV